MGMVKQMGVNSSSSPVASQVNVVPALSGIGGRYSGLHTLESFGVLARSNPNNSMESTAHGIGRTCRHPRFPSAP
ncbi:MAG TPA: hypothetical protein VGG85_09585 [Terracidiphilus sp.]|jgi:hypothetical protein